MADPTNVFSDAATAGTPFPFGGQLLTINSVNYISDGGNVNPEVDEIKRPNIYGVTADRLLIAKDFAGSWKCQLATATTPLPAMGMPFTITGPNAVTYACRVKSCSPAWSINSDTVFTLNFVKDLHSA